MRGIQGSQMLDSALAVKVFTGIGQESKKKCSKCKKEKLIEEFYTDKSKKDNFSSLCKECVKESAKDWKAKNPEKRKIITKKWRGNNKGQISESAKLYQKNNPEKLAAAARRWRKNNRSKAREKMNRYCKEKRSTPMGKLIDSIKSGIWRSLNGGKDNQHWEDILGYNVIQLKEHIEKQFTDGMDWNNHGKFGWHIDHKIPMSAYIFNSPSDPEFKLCWALSNLQPLWWKDNIRKKDKILYPELYKELTGR